MTNPNPSRLSDRLDEIRERFETGNTPREIVEALNADIERLLSKGVTDHARKVGEVISLDEVVQTKNESWSLQSLSGDRFLVLTWFRGNW